MLEVLCRVILSRFDYIGKHQEEVEVSRRELAQDDWTMEVPLSFEQRLRAWVFRSLPDERSRGWTCGAPAGRDT
jgi:hypothetical protein